MLLVSKIESALNVIRTCLRLRGSSIDNSIKRELLLTYLKLKLNKFPKVFKSQNNLEKILGFRFSFFHYETFIFLFDRIFIDLEYYFEADKKDPFIIDCGSNIGMSILFFKKIYPEATIIGFEPDQKTFAKLEENIGVNKLENVVVYRKAVSDVEGVTDFYYYPDHPGSLSMSMIKERIDKQCQKVESVVLSKYITTTVDFLKLDTEGAETAIIQELHKQNKLRYIKKMAIEYHHHFHHYHFTKQDDSFSKILRILEESGFGYQIKSDLEMPLERGQYQPIHIYAYQKSEIT